VEELTKEIYIHPNVLSSMNVVLIVSDTFRIDHLGCYGNDWIKTPNIDKLAEESTVFERAYAASFPTVPHRRDLVTGRYTFTYSDWSPLPPDEVVMADSLREAGYVTMMIADTPHILKDGYHFDRGYDGWIWIRGQENDRYSTNPVEYKFPCNPDKLRSPYSTVKQYLRNISERRYENDYFVAKTMAEAARWLERNSKHDKFFLYVDTFDPHEPWDPPEWYVNLYDPGYKGEEVTYPVYGPCDYLTPEELKHVRALYAGEVTMVDRWVGYLLKRVRNLGLWDNTAIIFTTDHGFYHGEHGLIGKSIIAQAAHGLAPLYNQVAHIPLIVKMPNTELSRCDAIVQPPDLMPTILEMAGAKTPHTVQGKSLLPLIEEKNPLWRDFAVSSPSIIHGPVAGQRISIISREWFLVYCGQIDDALRELPTERRIKIVDGLERLQKIVGERPKNELYNLSKDPDQLHNVFDEHRDVAEELHGKLVKLLESIRTAAEILKYWRELA
jgi:arylsulfatase A-like enzyme